MRHWPRFCRSHEDWTEDDWINNIHCWLDGKTFTNRGTDVNDRRAPKIWRVRAFCRGLQPFSRGQNKEGKTYKL